MKLKQMCPEPSVMDVFCSADIEETLVHQNSSSLLIFVKYMSRSDLHANYFFGWSKKHRDSVGTVDLQGVCNIWKWITGHRRDELWRSSLAETTSLTHTLASWFHPFPLLSQRVSSGHQPIQHLYWTVGCCLFMCVCVCSLAGGEAKGRQTPHFCSEKSYNWRGREVGHLYANRAVRIKLACLLLCFSASTTDKKKKNERASEAGAHTGLDEGDEHRKRKGVLLL